MAKKALSQEELIKVLREYISDKAEGNLSLAAEKLCTDKGHLSKVLSGQRSIGEDLASRLGFKKVKQKVTAVFYLEF